MKKFFIIIILAALSAASIAQVERTATIRYGRTMLSRPMAFTAADSIVTSDSLVITITNPQKYLQHQTMTTTLTDIDGGSPSVLITLRGRVTSVDDWHPIGTPVTWTTTGNNPTTITSTSPVNYNYLKVSYVASGAAQHLEVATFDLRTANTYEDGGITLTAGNDLIGSSTSDITFNTNKFTVAGATGNTLIAGTLSVTGATTATGLITANGGVTLGVGDDLIGSSTSDITINTDKFTVAGATGNTVIAGTLGVTGVATTNLRFGTVVVNTDESETLTAAQSGAIVTFDGAGTATIPDPSAATIGVIYYLLQTADANLIVTCTTADNNAFVCNGVATSDNVTISTSSHKIGAGMIVIGISATQWYVGGLNPESLLTPEAAD